MIGYEERDQAEQNIEAVKPELEKIQGDHCENSEKKKTATKNDAAQAESVKQGKHKRKRKTQQQQEQMVKMLKRTQKKSKECAKET